MCISPTILGLTIGMVTHGRKKFTWLRRWESLLVPRGQSAGCLEDPKTSSPSRCGVWLMKDNPDV
jgi:hypothetical protein